MNINKEEIQNAVSDLEANTAGELVVYLAKKSDNYALVKWGIGFWFLVSSILTIVMIYTLHLDVGFYERVGLILFCGVLGVGLPALFPRLNVLFLSEGYLAGEVYKKASTVFLEEQVFDTDDRIGILIYISQLEQRVTVLSDKGINGVVEQKDWDHVVASIVDGIKSKQNTNGILKGIAECKDLLLKHGFTNRVKPSNELSNHVRIEE